MLAHWQVYLFPENTPVRASASGSAFSASQEPPGRSGASQSSHARHRQISSVRLPSAMNLSQFESDFRKTPTLGDAERALLAAHRKVVAEAAEWARSVRRTAGACGVELGLGIRQAEDQHAVVQKRQHHRDQRRL